MRLAVFTNRFPSRTATFFARDMRGLRDAGAELDVFPFYPVDATLWPSVPSILDERFLPRARVHHTPLTPSLTWPSLHLAKRLPRYMSDSAAAVVSATRHGVGPIGKSAYVALKALGWAQRFPDGHDHVLAYWGSYTSTCAYIFHRLTNQRVPFSMIVHARADLYDAPVNLVRTMLYADNIFLVCEFNRGYIRDRYPEIYPRIAHKIHIHHLGLNLNDISANRDLEQPNTVLAVGRFEELKGFRYLLLAVDRLRRRGMSVHVRLIGGGEQERELRLLAERLHLEDQVTFLGWMPSDRVFHAMREASLLVHPPIAPDAMPTVIKEAAAAGTPVVASELGGIPEILDRGRCGILVPPGNVDELARAMEFMLTDPEARRRYAAAARSHMEQQFDLWRNAQRLLCRLQSTTRGDLP